MAKKISGAKTSGATSERGVHAASASGLQATSKRAEARAPKPAKPSSLLDTRVVYCGDNLESLAKLPDACVDLIYNDPPFNSNRNYDGGQSGSDSLHIRNIWHIIIIKKRLPYG